MFRKVIKNPVCSKNVGSKLGNTPTLKGLNVKSNWWNLSSLYTSLLDTRRIPDEYNGYSK